MGGRENIIWDIGQMKVRFDRLWFAVEVLNEIF